MSDDLKVGGGATTGEAKGLPASWPRAHNRRRPRICYLGQGTYVCNGPSGEQYRFVGHGAVLKVKDEDLDDILARTRVQRTCCGSAGERHQQLFTRS